ncbi:MAG: HAD-IIA family hydrolase [Chloroflexi bacterium]|nr:HAD-IIA family hydrolase [Chloroflexota bacterium]
MPESIALGALRSFVLDLDGVLFRGEQRLSGAAELLAYFERTGRRYRLLTNNSTRTPAEVSAHMARIGIRVRADLILTSSVAATQHLKRLRPSGARVFVIGEEGLRIPLEDAGFDLADDGHADYVMLGVDRFITYDKLKRATLLLRAGVPFIATNPDTTYPSPEGLVPGAGALIAALVASSGVSPVVIGKPSPEAFWLALDEMQADRAHAAALGDRLDTDIEGGDRAGIATILVLTGVSNRADAEASPLKPTWIFDDLPSLIAALEEADRSSGTYTGLR